VSYSYNPGSPTPVDYVRFLIADTGAPWILQDEEITNALFLTSTQGLYQSSSQFATGLISPASPSIGAVQVYSVWYAAAACLDGMAADKSYMASIQEMLDVKLDASKSAAALRAQAKEYRDREDNAGHFAIIEQVGNAFQARQRWWHRLLVAQAGS
jgi:hypothetical protein